VDCDVVACGVVACDVVACKCCGLNCCGPHCSGLYFSYSAVMGCTLVNVYTCLALTGNRSSFGSAYQQLMCMIWLQQLTMDVMANQDTEGKAVFCTPMFHFGRLVFAAVILSNMNPLQILHTHDPRVRISSVSFHRHVLYYAFKRDWLPRMLKKKKKKKVPVRSYCQKARRTAKESTP